MVRLLGEGGFGEVYLVENPLNHRRAAVKVLHTELARDAELVRRFLNEARAASAICHPNIIDVLDAGGTGRWSFQTPFFLHRIAFPDSQQAASWRPRHLIYPL
jgi:serine/threonine protein kinase